MLVIIELQYILHMESKVFPGLINILYTKLYKYNIII